VSGLAELARRQGYLRDIRGLMTAMKSLSLVETRKLARLIGHQQRMRANIEAAASDFMAFHPELAVDPDPSGVAVLVLVGAERGFCGGFDERLMRHLDAAPHAVRDACLLVVGRRLATRLGNRPGVVARLDGATVAEDVPAVLDRILDALHGLRQPAGPALLMALAHDEQGNPGLTQLLPLPRPTGPPPAGHAPGLNLAPAAFLAGLIDEFLLSALFGVLYVSLAAESHQRLARMEQAIDRLDDTLQSLTRRRNALRQEHIVEEIEVILANAMASQAQRGGGGPLSYQETSR
jgi:F-type H+-transporting ATPase subunit gamma